MHFSAVMSTQGSESRLREAAATTEEGQRGFSLSPDLMLVVSSCWVTGPGLCLDCIPYPTGYTAIGARNTRKLDLMSAHEHEIERWVFTKQQHKNKKTLRRKKQGKREMGWCQSWWTMLSRHIVDYFAIMSCPVGAGKVWVSEAVWRGISSGWTLEKGDQV